MSLLTNYARALSALECADRVTINNQEALCSASKLTYKADNVVFRFVWTEGVTEKTAAITEEAVSEAKFFANRMTVRTADDLPLAIELYSYAPCTF